MDEYEAEYMRGGATAVNALLEKNYPDTKARVSQMESMDATGRWEIRWHFPSDGEEGPDYGMIVDFAGR